MLKQGFIKAKQHEMKYFIDFLSSFSKVETVIGLLSFIVASILGYLAYITRLKYNKVSEIISKADTTDKTKLAASILNVFPSYSIPDLSQRQGFEVVKIQLKQSKEQFESKIRVLKFGILIFFLLILVLIGKSIFHYESNITNGPNSPIIHSDSPNIRYEINSIDSLK